MPLPEDSKVSSRMMEFDSSDEHIPLCPFCNCPVDQCFADHISPTITPEELVDLEDTPW